MARAPSLHKHLVGVGEGEPGTHVHLAPYIIRTATPNTHDTLTHSPFTQPCSQVLAHTQSC